ncbi:MAG: multiprotein-bridging factor 1 family protein [Candidatus Diapherotrites archaeon]|nr:multiprotein-bridging factor 1 family protein [Candidatus Diapherotrites archaeon]
MQCEVCGSESIKLLQVSLEGARVMACPECAKLGEVIPGKPSGFGKPFGIEKKSAFFEGQSQHLEDAPAMAEDFGLIVKKAREKLGITSEELALKVFEKASVIQKIEAGNFVPDDRAIKKLEAALGVKLSRPVES